MSTGISGFIHSAFLHAIMVLTSIIGEQFEGFIDILAKLIGKLEIEI